MPITSSSYQLKFDLDLPEEESSIVLSVEEIQARKDVARKRIEDPLTWPVVDGKPQEPYWYEDYLKLSTGRWPFRVAVLVAWLRTPKRYRWPKTKDELANLLGLSSARQFSVWIAKNPQIVAAVNAAWEEKAWERLQDSMDAMFEVASQPNYKGKYDRELHFKLIGILKDRVDLSSAGGSDDELLKNLPFSKLMEMAGINTPDKVAEFKERVAREHAEQMKQNEEDASNG